MRRWTGRCWRPLSPGWADSWPCFEPGHRGQCSIWPAGREVPAGWSAAGHRGPEADCPAHVDSSLLEATAKWPYMARRGDSGVRGLDSNTPEPDRRDRQQPEMDGQ
ncbi:MbtH family NRPS accessory protein [Dactylosporangium sp. NPDC005555]|uniref:MbtH family NRPS accessory protein n=1 Tax=Dactylosporangium sp. NPDC005555 TaxID=3154889 RepID=UPI0033B25B6B